MKIKQIKNLGMVVPAFAPLLSISCVERNDTPNVKDKYEVFSEVGENIVINEDNLFDGLSFDTNYRDAIWELFTYVDINPEEGEVEEILDENILWVTEFIDFNLEVSLDFLIDNGKVTIISFEVDLKELKYPNIHYEAGKDLINDSLSMRQWSGTIQKNLDMVFNQNISSWNARNDIYELSSGYTDLEGMNNFISNIADMEFKSKILSSDIETKWVEGQASSLEEFESIFLINDFSENIFSVVPKGRTFSLESEDGTAPIKWDNFNLDGNYIEINIKINNEYAKIFKEIIKMKDSFIHIDNTYNEIVTQTSFSEYDFINIENYSDISVEWDMLDSYFGTTNIFSQMKNLVNEEISLLSIRADRSSFYNESYLWLWFRNSEDEKLGFPIFVTHP